MNENLAQLGNSSTFSDLVGVLLGLIQIGVSLVFALALLYMLWRIIDAWVIHGGDAQKAAEGKQTVLIGILVLFVMATVWGLIELLVVGLGLAG